MTVVSYKANHRLPVSSDLFVSCSPAALSPSFKLNATAPLLIRTYVIPSFSPYETLYSRIRAILLLSLLTKTAFLRARVSVVKKVTDCRVNRHETVSVCMVHRTSRID